MTLREATYYTAVCDLCGDDHDHYEYTAWGDAEQADEAAEDSDWHVEGGNHICYLCVPVARDLLDDDQIDPGHGADGHRCYAVHSPPQVDGPAVSDLMSS